ncbi:hypothetical protein QE370_001130 [Aeromicrobium sp. SORGH_AS981]|uniref:hypothetical protein n=1 Tax=Aeromicrobium sp. SORGH_AS_0981 TaxID=3041802 RepID=UPI0028622B5B|nr:hypothetical protein [Aeromicrobium sp. SORGH_AS_0981]MDR6117946.1 hypothetical protein [Aeromicrobium sp. SORGH_AS_0981]
MRHCIGERSCASSTSTCAVPVVVDAGGGAQLVLDLALPSLEAHQLARHVVVALVVGRHLAQQVAQLVDEGDVLDGGDARGPRRDHRVELLAGERSVGELPDPLGQGAPELDGVDRRPPRLDEVDVAVVGGELVEEALLALLERPLARHLLPQRPRHGGRRLRVRAVAGQIREQPTADVGELLGVEDEHVVLVEVAERRRLAGLRRRGQAPQHGQHARRALGRGGDRLVVLARADPVNDLAERAQRHGGLAEARQHPLDVAHEHRRRADDEHAAGLEASAVGVQQVGRAVQRHDGLARAGAAADDRRAAAGRPDGLVLLLLDRGDDGVHGAVAGPREAGEQRALADDDHVVGGVLRVEQVVLDPDDGLARAAQDATAHDAGGVLGGRLVEQRGCRRTPVDEQDLAVGVADTDPADVPGLAALQVEAAEHEAVVRGIQGRQAAGGLEDHRVTLDQTALVADVPTGEALGDERLRHLRGLVEAAVDDVDVRLLRCDLCGGLLLGGHASPRLSWVVLRTPHDTRRPPTKTPPVRGWWDARPVVSAR